MIYFLSLLAFFLSGSNAYAQAEKVNFSEPEYMGFDIATLTGLFGVILTVIFFVIGYRQTIGARKERAAAANREILDTLMRRFSLDSNFDINLNEVESYLIGKSLENQVKKSDIYSINEIFYIIYSRVLSSEYVSSGKRKGLLEKIINYINEISEQKGTVKTAIGEIKEKRSHYTELLLAITSAIMAGFVVFSANIIVDKELSKIDFDKNQIFLNPAFWAMVAGITLTAVALFVFVRVREEASKPESDIMSDSPSGMLAKSFETQIINRLQALGIEFTQHRDVDLIMVLNGSRIAIELKMNLPIHRTRTVRRQMSRILKIYDCEKGYIVVGTPIPEGLKRAKNDNIQIIDVDDLFNIVEGKKLISKK